MEQPRECAQAVPTSRHNRYSLVNSFGGGFAGCLDALADDLFARQMAACAIYWLSLPVVIALLAGRPPGWSALWPVCNLFLFSPIISRIFRSPSYKAIRR